MKKIFEGMIVPSIKELKAAKAEGCCMSEVKEGHEVEFRIDKNRITYDVLVPDHTPVSCDVELKYLSVKKHPVNGVLASVTAVVHVADSCFTFYDLDVFRLKSDNLRFNVAGPKAFGKTMSGKQKHTMYLEGKVHELINEALNADPKLQALPIPEETQRPIQMQALEEAVRNSEFGERLSAALFDEKVKEFDGKPIVLAPLKEYPGISLRTVVVDGVQWWPQNPVRRAKDGVGFTKSAKEAQNGVKLIWGFRDKKLVAGIRNGEYRQII